MNRFGIILPSEIVPQSVGAFAHSQVQQCPFPYLPYSLNADASHGRHLTQVVCRAAYPEQVDEHFTFPVRQHVLEN